MKPNDLAIRKRSQIAHANRTMFITVAAASAIVSFAVVAAIFLGQKLVFGEKVLIEKNKTITTLNANNKAVEDLKTQVLVLDTDTSLAKLKANASDKAIQVILDALPSEANSLALGASLQNRLLVGIGNLELETLQVEPVQGIETIQDESAVDASTETDTENANQILFSFSVTGNQEQLMTVLSNLERSIRTIDVTRVTIESQGSAQLMTVTGRAFYEPAKSVTPYDIIVKPGKD